VRAQNIGESVSTQLNRGLNYQTQENFVFMPALSKPKAVVIPEPREFCTAVGRLPVDSDLVEVNADPASDHVCVACFERLTESDVALGFGNRVARPSTASCFREPTDEQRLTWSNRALDGGAQAWARDA
jgi:hypothetical protein